MSISAMMAAAVAVRIMGCVSQNASAVGGKLELVEGDELLLG